MSSEQTEDLKAFERRLTEVISQLQPITVKWRIVLLVTALFTVVGAFYWLTDVETYKVSFLDSLSNHMVFTCSSLLLCILFLSGIHDRVIAAYIIASRSRLVLADYNMSCDDTGKLILKPRPGT